MEADFLLKLLRARFSTLLKINLFDYDLSKLNWFRLITLAQRHKVAALLHSQLDSHYPELVPPAVLNELATWFQANAIRSLTLTAELVRLVGLFDEAGLSMLTFKGPVLSQLAYGDLAARQFVDLDILVPQADLPRAVKLLQTPGYQPQFVLTAAQQANYARTNYELTFKQPNGQTLDLHWALLPKGYSFTPPPSLAWARLFELELAGQTVRTLPPEETLLFLCAHAAKDSWSSLGAVCDIAQLLASQPDLDWDWLAAHHDQLGNRRMFYLGLYLAQSLLGVGLPGPILQKLLNEPGLASLASRAVAQMFAPPDLLGWYTTNNLYLQSMPRTTDRTRYWFEAAVRPGPDDWAAVPLPSALTPFYYPIRLYRLARKYLAKRA